MNRMIQNLKDVREDAGRGWFGYTTGSKLHKRMRLIDLMIEIEERDIEQTLTNCNRCSKRVGIKD